ncbi:MAG TPA: hypothetical protein VNQ81_01415 [Povalibacter sp.]|nr:hypothetical protein [Povalibacter sp.]
MTANADQARPQEHGRETEAVVVRSSALHKQPPGPADERDAALLLSDFEGLVCYADAHCRKLTGDITRGQPWTHVVSQEDRDWVEAAWTESLVTRLPFCAEFRVGAARRQHWVRARGVYRRDMFDDGMPGWAVNFTDCGVLPLSASCA